MTTTLHETFGTRKTRTTTRIHTHTKKTGCSIYTHRGTYRPRTIGQRPYPREAGILLDIPPVVQIDIYENTTILTRRGPQSWRSYPVDTDELVQALTSQGQSSGLLPQNCLAHGRLKGHRFYVVYIPIGRQTLRTLTTSMEIPTPPLVWAGWQREYRLWALNTTEYPTTTTPLYAAPFPNIYNNGSICWGTAQQDVPDASSGIMDAFTLFMQGSMFNRHLSNNKSKSTPACVMLLYPKLNGVYPLDDLQTAQRTTLEQVINGEVWP